MIIFHHDDLDGVSAAAILYWNIEDENKKLVMLDYDKEISFDDVEADETVYIVDFSFKPPVMEELLKITKNVIWIDHHKSAADYKYSMEIPGLRDVRDKMFSGCELTWKFLFGELEMPDAIKYIGDFDKWKWAYGEETKKFKEGMLSLDWNDPTKTLWNDLLESNNNNTKDIMQRGAICLKYKEGILQEYKDKFSFEVTFEGKKCLACGFYAFGSELFEDVLDDYEMVINFEFDGKIYHYGLYSNGGVDVSVICQKYGGGGHKGAGGFSTKEFLLNDI